MANEAHWVAAWTNGLVTVNKAAFDNQTLRMVARVTIGGARLRVRLSNLYGAEKLALGAVRVGLRSGATAGVVPGSDRKLTFGGDDSVAIAPGTLAVSDAVELDFPALADLAVSVHVLGAVRESFPITGHGNCHQTNYLSPPGDFTAALAMPVKETTENWYFLSAIEVVAPKDTLGILCFGDLLTEGNLSNSIAIIVGPISSPGASTRAVAACAP